MSAVLQATSPREEVRREKTLRRMGVGEQYPEYHEVPTEMRKTIKEVATKIYELQHWKKQECKEKTDP